MSSLQQQEKFPLTHDLVIAEYTSLREEILKLTDIQHQLVTIALLSFGTLIGTGIAYRNASIILIYPIIALFLSAGWFSHAYGIDLLAHHIQNHIETKVGTEYIGWETQTHSRKLSISHSLLAFWGARGIFPATQWIAIGAGIAVTNFNLLLLFAALLSALLGVIFLPAIAWAQRARNRLVR